MLNDIRSTAHTVHVSEVKCRLNTPRPGTSPDFPSSSLLTPLLGSGLYSSVTVRLVLIVPFTHSTSSSVCVTGSDQETVIEGWISFGRGAGIPSSSITILGRAEFGAELFAELFAEFDRELCDDWRSGDRPRLGVAAGVTAGDGARDGALDAERDPIGENAVITDDVVGWACRPSISAWISMLTLPWAWVSYGASS